MHTFHLMLARNKLDTCQIRKVRISYRHLPCDRVQSVSPKRGQTRFLFGWPWRLPNRAQTDFLELTLTQRHLFAQKPGSDPIFIWSNGRYPSKSAKPGLTPVLELTLTQRDFVAQKPGSDPIFIWLNGRYPSNSAKPGPTPVLEPIVE
ncbi:hypothetical protein [Massilia eurypsychrophila]|uniref:hypothetical protein n=1 Tax=Massilia eurypsychrophila TaxID=1485217 RepID=UPI00103C739D